MLESNLNNKDNYRVALIWPPLGERFSYYRFGPRITNLGHGYLESFLKGHKDISCTQIDIDNLIHNKTDFWMETDKGGMLEDDSQIEQYMEGQYKSQLFDGIYEFLINSRDWKSFDFIGVKFDLECILDRYAPVFFRFLNTLGTEYNIPIMVGGTGFVSMDHLKFFKRFPFIKYLSFGTIDSVNLESFIKVIRYEKEHEGSLEEISNICYRDEKSAARMNIYRETAKASVESEYILRPVFHLKEGKDFRTAYSDLRKYDKGFLEEPLDKNLEVPIIPYRFTVGCVNKCAFCMCSAKGQVFAFKDPEKVADDMDMLMQENGSRYFMFLNAMLNFSKKYLDKLLNELKKRNLDIYFSDSAEVHGMDDEMLCIIKEMGGVALWYGLECPSDKLLKLIHKNCTVAEAESVLEKSNKMGIWNGVNLISGLPHENDEDIQMTVDFIRKNVSLVDMWQVTPFYLVKSKFLENPENYNIKVRDRVVSADKGEGNLVMASFDEIGGLSWPEKQEKTAKGFKLFLETIDEYAQVPNISNAGFVFHAYSKFGRNGKPQVREWLKNNYTGKAPEIRFTGA